MPRNSTPDNTMAPRASGEHPPEPAAPTWHHGLAAALLLLHFVLAWSGRAFGIDTGNDQATYVLLARSLRDFGYNDVAMLGTPAHTGYPPIFPALLALASLPFGERFGVLQGFVVSCSVIALVLLYDAVRRRSGSVVALTVLALCAVNPELVRYAGQIMSETPYMMFTVLAVWAVVREPPASNDAGWRALRWPAVAMAAAICAALTRTIGVTLIAALLVFWLLEGRYRRALTFAGMAALTVGSWIVWTLQEPVKYAGGSYIADATFVAGARQSLASALLTRVTTNVPTYLSAKLPQVLPQPTVSGTLIDNIVGVLLLLALAVIGGWLLWKRTRIVVLYVLAYGALLALWPWQITRFLVPVLPFVLWMFVAGAFRAAEMRRWLRPLPLAVGAVVLATAIARDVSFLGAASRCDRNAAMTSAACYDEVERSFFAAASFIRHQTPDTAIILAIKEATLYYVAERRAARYVSLGRDSGAVLAQNLRSQSVDYILLSPLRDARSQHVAALRHICGELEVVREFVPSTLVLRIAPIGSPPRENACASLERYERESPRWVEATRA